MTNRDHRTDEPATRCTEPRVVWSHHGYPANVSCGNLLPCMDHPQRCVEPREAGGPFASLSCGSELPCARHSVEQGEQNGEADALLPCPFCGTRPWWSCAIGFGQEMWQARCSFCGAQTHFLTPNKAEAIASWNRRADALQRERDEYREALREIASSPPLPHPGMLMAKARDVLAKWSRKNGGR